MSTDFPALSKFQIKYLINKGVPIKVIYRLDSLPEVLAGKIKTAMETAVSYRVMLLLGSESLQKEIFAAKMLIGMALSNPSSVAMCQALTLCRFDKEDITSSPADIQAVMGLSMVQAGFAAQRVKEFLMNVIGTSHGFLILGAESLQSIGDIYGQSFADYLKSISFGVDIPLEKALYINL